MKLTEHFSLGELVASDYAIRHGINNMPVDHEVLSNLNALALGLERARAVLLLPMHINSGYRSPKVNAGIGGAQNSAHLRGLAADFVIHGVSPREVCLRLQEHADTIGFDKLIHEGTWTHISFPEAEERPRAQVLTAIFKPGQSTTYMKGIA